MSAGYAAALAGGIAGGVIVVAVLVRLVVAVTRLESVMRELVRTVEDLRNARVEEVQAVRGVVAVEALEAADAVEENGHRPLRVRGRLDLGLWAPVIKARALGRGTSEAARQLRQHSRSAGPAREPRRGR